MPDGRMVPTFLVRIPDQPVSQPARRVDGDGEQSSERRRLVVRSERRGLFRARPTYESRKSGDAEMGKLVMKKAAA